MRTLALFALLFCAVAFAPAADACDGSVFGFSQPCGVSYGYGFSQPAFVHQQFVSPFGFHSFHSPVVAFRQPVFARQRVVVRNGFFGRRQVVVNRGFRSSVFFAY